MPRYTWIFSVFCLSAVLVMTFTSLAPAQHRVRAKIGIRIQSGDTIVRAKTKERITTRDLLRLYIIPEEDSYVYIVHTDKKSVNLLNEKGKTQFKQGTIIIIPSDYSFDLRFDGANLRETLTIICSPTRLGDVETLLFKSVDVPYTKWVGLEKEMINKSKIPLGGKSEKPFPIAGSVRGIEGYGTPNDPFLKDLRIYSGKSLLVKKYEFTVKK